MSDLDNINFERENTDLEIEMLRDKLSHMTNDRVALIYKIEKMESLIERLVVCLDVDNSWNNFLESVYVDAMGRKSGVGDNQ